MKMSGSNVGNLCYAVNVDGRQVVLLLGACPFPDRLDIRWFSTTLAGLGSRFHKHAVRAALSMPRSAARTAVVLEAISEGGVAASMALDELCPESTSGGDALNGRALANQVRSFVPRRPYNLGA